MSGERAIDVALGFCVASGYEEWEAAWDWFEQAMPDLYRKLIGPSRSSVYAESLARLASGNYSGV